MGAGWHYTGGFVITLHLWVGDDITPVGALALCQWVGDNTTPLVPVALHLCVCVTLHLWVHNDITPVGAWWHYTCGWVMALHLCVNHNITPVGAWWHYTCGCMMTCDDITPVGTWWHVMTLHLWVQDDITPVGTWWRDGITPVDVMALLLLGHDDTTLVDVMMCLCGCMMTTAAYGNLTAVWVYGWICRCEDGCLCDGC